MSKQKHRGRSTRNDFFLLLLLSCHTVSIELCITLSRFHVSCTQRFTLWEVSDVTVLLFYQIFLTAGSIHLQTHIYTDNISVHINPAHSKTHIKSKRAYSLRSIGASHSNVVFATLSLFSVFRCTISLTRCNFFLLHPAKNIMCV